MRWPSDKQPSADLKLWHDWFAWYPVKITYAWPSADDRLGQLTNTATMTIWWETVERKGTFHRVERPYHPGSLLAPVRTWWTWEYRLPKWLR